MAMIAAVAVLNTLGMGLRDAFLMAWEVWWALVLGFAMSAIVQAWVPRQPAALRLSALRAASARARPDADAAHQHPAADEQRSARQRLTSTRAWSDVADNFR